MLEASEAEQHGWPLAWGLKTQICRGARQITHAIGQVVLWQTRELQPEAGEWLSPVYSMVGPLSSFQEKQEMWIFFFILNTKSPECVAVNSKESLSVATVNPDDRLRCPLPSF